MGRLVNNIYDHVGFNEGDKDGHLTIYARSVAVSWACTRTNNKHCIDSAKAAYSGWMNDPDNENSINGYKLLEL